MFKRNTIGRQITFVMVMLLIYVIVVGFVSILQTKSMETNAKDITQKVMPAMNQINNITFASEHIQKLSYDYYLAADDEGKRKAIGEERLQTIRYLSKSKTAYEANITNEEIQINMMLLQRNGIPIVK